MAYKTGNPVLSEKSFENLSRIGEKMTLDGTVNKTILLLGVLIASGSFGWIYLSQYPVLVLPAAIFALIIAFIIVFKKNLAPILAPVYAVTEGIVLGIISSLYNEQYAGIVLQAVALTIAIAAVMLLLYKTRVIQATKNFQLAVVSATTGIALLYIIDLGMRFFGNGFAFISGGGPIGIAFSVFVVGIASLNLVMDFDFIEKGAASGAPKYMEWYGAFGLIVTLVWLYLEILRLLSKLRR